MRTEGPSRALDSWWKFAGLKPLIRLPLSGELDRRTFFSPFKFFLRYASFCQLILFLCLLIIPVIFITLWCPFDFYNLQSHPFALPSRVCVNFLFGNQFHFTKITSVSVKVTSLRLKWCSFLRLFVICTVICHANFTSKVRCCGLFCFVFFCSGFPRKVD